MKAMKKAFALLLAMIMVFGLAATGFAATNTETANIVINDAYPGETYNAYRIFDLTYEKDAGQGKGFTYTLSEKWAGFDDYEGVSDIFTVDDVTDIVTWVGDSNDYGTSVNALAKLAAAFLKSKANAGNTITPDGGPLTGPDDGDDDGVESDTPVKFDNMPLGYYFVTTTTGTLCSLDTNHQEVEIFEKNEPSIPDKKQQEDGDGSYTDAENTAAVGDVVNYQAELDLKQGAKNMVMHDVMTPGLTYNGDAVVYTDAAMSQALGASNYKHYKAGDTIPEGEAALCADCDFEIRFNQAYLDTIDADGVKLYVKYSATLNEDAVMPADENATNKNSNKIQLKWGNNQHSEWDEVETMSFEITINKWTEGATAGSKVQLADASFKLFKANTDGTKGTETVKMFSSKKNTTATDDMEIYTVCDGTCATVDPDATHATHIEEITTNASGKFNIEGLDDGTYYLEETKAPDGYNKLKYDIKIVVDHDTKPVKYYTTIDGIKWTEGDALSKETANEIGVENKTGNELPSTGGVGTTLFYVCGSIMILGAVVLLITKKRMSV